jgi:DNA-binding MarR family transcriptional regulator
MDVKILRVLGESSTPKIQVTLEQNEKIGLSRRSLTPRLDRLRHLGLIHRPLGERSGDAITPKGREILANFPSEPSH